MKSFATFLAGASLLASTARAADLPGLLSGLTSLNLTTLLSVVTTIQNTPGGSRLLSLLEQNSSTVTVFAPSNEAFDGVNPYFSQDPNWLQQALAYHVVPENIDINNVPSSPEAGIYPTALNDTSLVKHFGSIPQYVALTKMGSTVSFLNQNDEGSHVVQAVVYKNVNIFVISAVLDLPPGLAYGLTLPSYSWTSNLTTLVKLAAPLIPSLDAAKQLTVFAPTNQAFSDAISHGRISTDTPQSTVNTILSNHIVNGTILFTGNDQTNYTSAGGEMLTFGKGGAFGYVVYYKGELVANVIQANIITQSGVVHIIDAVLPQTDSNAGAASSAYSSELAAATSTAAPAKRTLGSSRFFLF